MDGKSLKICREVARSWQRCNDEKNISWIRIVYIPNIIEFEKKRPTYFQNHQDNSNKTKEDFSPETRPWPIVKKSLQRWLKKKAICRFNPNQTKLFGPLRN